MAQIIARTIINRGQIFGSIFELVIAFMKEFFGSVYFLLLVVAMVLLILVKEIVKARSAGQKGLVFSLSLTVAVVVVATGVVFLAL